MDTCVVVTAFRSRNGASRVVLDWVGDRLLVPLLTPALVLQYEDVLKRLEQLRASRLTPEQVNEILADGSTQSGGSSRDAPPGGPLEVLAKS